jgi:ribonuclease inhibitor
MHRDVDDVAAPADETRAVPVVVLEGDRIQSVLDFHRQMSDLLGFGPYDGQNLAALWDRLSVDVRRPVHLIWRDALASRSTLGDHEFGAIVAVLDRTVEQDESAGQVDRFTYALID